MSEDDGEDSGSVQVVPASEVSAEQALDKLIDLGRDYLSHSGRELELRTELAKEDFKFKEKQLQHGRHTFGLKMALLGFIVLAVFGISYVLILGVGDVQSGLLVLSHIGAAVLGLLSGAGWERTKQGANQ